MKFTDLRGEIRLHEPMSGHTSFRIGGNADALVFPVDRQDLAALLREIRDQRLPFVVLGGGTNLLVRDGGFRGAAISLKKMADIDISREYRSLGGSFAVITVEAGAMLARLLSFSVEHGLTGFEFSTGIPGTVGGAVCMNAGTAQGEMGDIIDTVTLVAPDGELILRHREEMGFGYRTANIPADHVVLDAKILLRYGDAGKIKARVKQIMAGRKERQPWGLPNAGSVFKNPLDESAGKLIESAGCKGLTVGGAQVSQKHANFIVNRGNATAADVLQLMELIKEKVLEMHRVRLEPEIKIIGED
ncbi:MAG: UDP-N-acetylmuramate dehydrogenase [Nitrospirota bacterium]